VMRLDDMLEDKDDVQNVSTNANFSDDVLEQLGHCAGIIFNVEF